MWARAALPNSSCKEFGCQRSMAGETSRIDRFANFMSLRLGSLYGSRTGQLGGRSNQNSLSMVLVPFLQETSLLPSLVNSNIFQFTISIGECHT